MFNKLILGRYELDEFECLFLKEKLIDSFHIDSGQSTVSIDKAYKYAQRNRIEDKDRLLIALMLFERIDSTYPSDFDFRVLNEAGVIEENYCINKGATKESQTSKILDGMWHVTNDIKQIVCDAMELVFQKSNETIYVRNYISEEDIISLCSTFLYNTKIAFVKEFKKALIHVANEYIREKVVQSYGNAIENIFEYDLEFELEAEIKAEQIYELRKKYINEQVKIYTYYTNLLDSCTESLALCSSCGSCSIRQCDKCSKFTEFYGYMQMENREEMGVERLSQLNGLIKSQTENGSLFDNSIKFKTQPFQMDKIEQIDNIYQIVNVDMSSKLASLPIPESVNQALRLRENPNMKSFRNVFTKWIDCIYNGEIDEAEYIQKDFDAANAYFKKKQISDKKNTSLLKCSFVALINQIPYLSNIIGLVSPFVSRNAILEEEKHKWIHLTR